MKNQFHCCFPTWTCHASHTVYRHKTMFFSPDVILQRFIFFYVMFTKKGPIRDTAHSTDQALACRHFAVSLCNCPRGQGEVAGERESGWCTNELGAPMPPGDMEEQMPLRLVLGQERTHWQHIPLKCHIVWHRIHSCATFQRPSKKIEGTTCRRCKGLCLAVYWFISSERCYCLTPPVSHVPETTPNLLSRAVRTRTNSGLSQCVGIPAEGQNH